MKGIIDIHNHILYDVDDGAKNLDEALGMIEDEYKQGVRKIIFTPHFQGGVYENKMEVISERFESISKCVKEKYSDMELYIGNEVLLSGNVAELIKSNRIYTMAGSKYVLVEFVPSVIYDILEKKVREVLLEGYIPIVAHCERYECLQKNIGRVHHLVEVGAYIQVNAGITKTFKGRKFMKMLADCDCLHFIGSDAHDRKMRGVHFDKCVKLIEKKYGEEYVRWLLIENPQSVIDNHYI